MSDISEFLQGGAMRVPFMSSDLFSCLEAGYLRLLTEPKEVRDGWELDFEKRGDPDDGLVRRRKGDPRSVLRDEKYYFHYRRRVPPALLRGGVDIARYYNWLLLCDTMLDRVREDARVFAGQLDSALPGYSFAERVKKSRGHVLRILHYDAQELDGVIGCEHNDRCAFTYHIAESYPGMVGPDGGIIPAVKDHALLFPGLKLEKLTCGRVQSMRHGARGKAGEARTAMIGFIHFDDIDISDLLARQGMR